ncbi:MAG: transglycosylase SLT domain-containing protein, partial [Gammaproteobacteria bacterium]
MPLTNLSKGGLIALIISLAGCQTVQENTVAVSQTDVTSDRVSSTEPNLTDVIEPSLSDEAMYDPLAIVRELGEAIDSPNVNESVDENDPEVEPKTDLAAIEGTVWAEIINGFALEDLKETKYADLHRRRLTHSPGFFSDFLVKADIYLPYVWTEVKRRGLPAELALLPYVESAYSPWAVSRMGAVGMWQIM